MPKSFVPVKPMYTPDEQVEAGLYTDGKEWMTVEGFEEYIGLYHKYPNGAVYSEGTFNSDNWPSEVQNKFKKDIKQDALEEMIINDEY